ncbi:hypothetical protein DdX_15360 [Ditylenchus destructor]|uniref:Uncharacterized protein n=1 Tax=Ditylenchus destructor TaxID=166010 RepID=A0AAD4MQH3_9BILA|nr:hypothetical protein DdX_15360 [Ditylenchus destructor]
MNAILILGLFFLGLVASNPSSGSENSQNMTESECNERHPRQPTICGPPLPAEQCHEQCVNREHYAHFIAQEDQCCCTCQKQA